ncbi:MAG: ABC transporter ATP-binding protein [Anaerolineae bacterium]|nr:ABC transporter ATP-binding protein [Anaerolineae bacterium]
MGFIMDGLDAEAYDRTYKDSELLKRIVVYFKPEIGRIVVVAIAVTLSSLMNLALPVVISMVLDRVQTDPSTRTLITAALAVAGIASLGWVFNWAHRRLAAQGIGNVVIRMREDAFDAIMRRDLSFYDQFPSGKIVSRITSDTQAFTQVVTLTMDLLSRILTVVLLIGYLFTVSAYLTLILLALAPFIFAVALAFRKIARDTITQQRRVAANVSSHIQETVSGIGVAKTFRQEQAVYDEFLDVNKKSFWIGLKTGFVFSGIFPILGILAGFGTAALTYWGGLVALAGTITAGAWYLFIQGINAFWFPLTSIASFWSQFQLGLAAAERIFALFDAEAKVQQIGEVRLEDVQGDIRFEGVDFRYNEKEAVLEDFSLHIPAGKTYALVGHTGSGKSSIGKLIARFYEFQGGKISIDGHDIRSLALRSYREKLGIVTQTPFLFDGTVMDNIRYGKPDATDEEVVKAARTVGRGDWIDSLPQGLATEVGERGGSLSMGQRQLVALARVLLEDPSIFILDEATASVDPLTETLIQEGLDVVLKNRTSVVIAHRLSTIKHADQIIVLREGKIIERGTHDELLAQGGHYAELYNTYFRHQSLEYIEKMGDRG